MDHIEPQYEDLILLFGLGESCSHVAAVLFKIEAAVRLGITNPACTSKPCEWNDYFTSKVCPAPIKDIEFYRSEVVERVQVNGRKRRATVDMPGTTYNEQQEFLRSLLQLKSTPVGLSLFRETSPNFKSKKPFTPTASLPVPLRSNYSPQNLHLSESELQVKVGQVIQNISITQSQIDYLEQSTHGQSSIIMWHRQRAGRISSSTSHSVLHTDSNNPAPSVIKNITKLNTKPILSRSIIYGQENEGKVFKMFSDAADSIHTNTKLITTGMKVSMAHPWLSASADGTMTCDCHGTSVLEIKFPWQAKDSTPEEFIADPSSYMYQGVLKKSNQYYTQVQIEMFVYEANSCDFVVFVNGSLIHQAIPKDSEFLDEIIPKLKRFWEKNIVPELLTRSLENMNDKDSPILKETSQKLYCYCQEPEGTTQMVGCDGKDCPYEWVHLSCIRPSRKTVPKGNWYCRACKKSK